MDDPVSIPILNIMALMVPAGVAYEMAMQLKVGLLDKYMLTPGVPTPTEPNPQPVLRLKEDEE